MTREVESDWVLFWMRVCFSRGYLSMTLSQRVFLLYKYSSLYFCRAAQASPFTRIIKNPIRRINHSVVASVSQDTLRPVGCVPDH